MHLIKWSFVLAWSLSPMPSMWVLTVLLPRPISFPPSESRCAFCWCKSIQTRPVSKNAAVHGGQSSLYSVSFHRGRPWRLWALRSGKCFKEQHIHPEERCSQLWNPCDVSTSQGKETGSLLVKKAFIKETNVKYKCNLGLGMWIRPWNDPFS